MMFRQSRQGSAGSWLVDGVLLAAWTTSIGLVLLYEHGVWGGTFNFSRSLPASLAVQEQWFGVYYQDRKIGFTHLVLAPDQQDGMPGMSLVDQGRLRFSLLGSAQVIDLFTKTFIDADWTLRKFLAVVSTEQSRLEIAGRRQGDELLLTLATPSSIMHQRVRDPTGRIWISGLSSWVAFHRLKEGQHGRLWILNPLALKPEPVSFRVARRDTVNGQEALVVEAAYHGITTATWMTPSGIVLKEVSPLGWTLVQEPMKQAMAVEAATTPPLELLSTVAVPVDRPLGDPAALTRLTLQVEGVGASVFRVDRRPWQELLPLEPMTPADSPSPQGPRCLIRLQAPVLAGATGHHPAPPRRYVSPSLFIQSDDPEIRRQARQIVGTLTDHWSCAQRLNEWVFQTLIKRLTIGFPSAKDVLMSRTGDCHEHTVLFTALARSLGIPTRMAAGLVYYQDRFYYHAWPEVWVAASDSNPTAGRGCWIPLDPTLGEPIADAAHLGLVEAEGEELLWLAQVVGNMRLRVLAIETHAAGGS